jgi:sugar transferase (PEP-CTERM/EpsH1 system associated)
MAEYLFRSAHAEGRLARTRKIMDLMDVDSYKWRQYAARSSFAQALVYRYESRRLEEYERRIYREFDRLMLVSEQEKAYFPSPETEKLVAVFNGVDLEYFRSDAASGGALPGYDEARPSLVFTGMMDYWPNVEGMQWFIAAVLPLIRAAVPGVRLYVVGGRPSRDVLGWAADPDVVVTGFVPDVRAYLRKADVCIAPLRVARGIQNKVLEAMAMSKAVVSTPEAHEGIEADPRDEVCVAQGEEAFAASVVALLRDRQRAQTLGQRARACVERRYSWTANLSRLDDLIAAQRGGHERALSVGGQAVAGV